MSLGGVGHVELSEGFFGLTVHICFGQLGGDMTIGLILEENDLAKYIKEEVAKPKEDEAKEKHKKDLIRE